MNRYAHIRGIKSTRSYFCSLRYESAVHSHWGVGTIAKPRCARSAGVHRDDGPKQEPHPRWRHPRMRGTHCACDGTHLRRNRQGEATRCSGDRNWTSEHGQQPDTCLEEDQWSKCSKDWPRSQERKQGINPSTTFATQLEERQRDTHQPPEKAKSHYRSTCAAIATSPGMAVTNCHTRAKRQLLNYYTSVLPAYLLQYK